MSGFWIDAARKQARCRVNRPRMGGDLTACHWANDLSTPIYSLASRCQIRSLSPGQTDTFWHLGGGRNGRRPGGRPQRTADPGRRYRRGMAHDHYFDRAEDGKHTADYKKHTPDILEAFDAFDHLVFAEEGREIPLKFRELMAVAVGITTQCVYCIDWHSRQARKAGATDAELAEAAWVATAIRAGGGFAHGRLAFKFAGPHEHSAG